jgi:hypothetical protein
MFTSLDGHNHLFYRTNRQKQEKFNYYVIVTFVACTKQIFILSGPYLFAVLLENILIYVHCK